MNFPKFSEFSAKTESPLPREKEWVKNRAVSSAFICFERNRCVVVSVIKSLILQGTGGGVDFMNYKTLFSHSKTMGYAFHFAHFYGICEELGFVSRGSMSRTRTQKPVPTRDQNR